MVKNRKVWHRLSVMGRTLMFIMLVVACSQKNKEMELVLLHTNDTHGTVVAIEGIGGLAERATFIKQVREKNKYTLLVDAGDINIGQPASNLAMAKPDFLAYKYMKYDAVVPGNHEFDHPINIFLEQMKSVNFPFLTSNIEREGKLLGKPYIIKEYGNVKIGLFGLTTKHTQNLSVGATCLVFLDEIETAHKMVQLLKEKEVDIIIAVTHLGMIEITPGFITSAKLAEQVDGIDIIVDGHSHAYLEKPEIVNGTYIVTANQGGRYVGNGKLHIINKKLAKFDWEPVLMKGLTPDPVLKEVLQPFVDVAKRDLNTLIGEATAPFALFKDRENMARYGETPLGNLVTDAMYWKAGKLFKMKISFALINSGGIRQGIPEGAITKNEVLTVLPFGDELDVVRMTGKEVTYLFDFLAAVPMGSGAFPQLSKEVQVVINRKEQRIEELKINNQVVVDTAIYYMATCNYITSGRDSYNFGLPSIVRKESTSCYISEALIEYIRMQGQIIPRLEGRIKVK